MPLNKTSDQSFDDYINEDTEIFSNENRENSANIITDKNVATIVKNILENYAEAHGLPNPERNFNRLIQSLAFLPAEMTIVSINTPRPRTNLCDTCRYFWNGLQYNAHKEDEDSKLMDVKDQKKKKYKKTKDKMENKIKNYNAVLSVKKGFDSEGKSLTIRGDFPAKKICVLPDYKYSFHIQWPNVYHVKNDIRNLKEDDFVKAAQEYQQNQAKRVTKSDKYMF
ncbi:hypothetical protein Glove_84g146 [Diversispora epigaea]|uniref:Uncharacterized protein n=1 Tax=Diversispora epigaea TaxID=1348612 RepID=A0A397J879_9GLOM|nr:hypothetical protein Glove_84g146 [Diversispora epigaea]